MEPESRTKRASEMDSIAAKGEADSSIPSNPRVEEEDSSEEEEDVSEDEDKDEYEVINYIRLKKRASEPEPEWDVDSYDGRDYKTDPKIAIYSPTKTNIMNIVSASANFSRARKNGIYSYCDLEAESDAIKREKEGLKKLASLCFDKFNEGKEWPVQLDSVLRANFSGRAEWKFYLTCMAREYRNAPLVEYQAKVIKFAGDYKPPFPILCRPTQKLT